MPNLWNGKIWLGAVVCVALAAGIWRYVIHRHRLKTHPMKTALSASTITWMPFLRGQGAILFGFLVMGGALGWLSTIYGLGGSQVTTDGKLIEFRQVDIGEHPVYEEIDVEGYHHLSAFATALAPPASKISIRVIPHESQSGGQGVAFESGDSSWTKLEETISAKRVTMVIEGLQPVAAKSGKADVIVFLSKQ